MKGFKRLALLEHSVKGFKRLALLGAVVLSLGLPVQALAQAPTGDQYSDDDISTLNCGSDPGNSGDPGDPGNSGDPGDPGNSGNSDDPTDPCTPAESTTTSGTGGSLPFTGLDMVFVALAGGLLFALGVGMRHLTRTADAA
jgi:hypothetical protein